MEKILEKTVEIMGNEYKVINSFDESEEIELNGVIAVNIANKTPLNHGTAKDFSLTINVSGQYFTDQDLQQKKIQKMFNYAYDKLDAINFSEYYEDCAGGSILQGDIISDGETNNFTISFELYICKD